MLSLQITLPFNWSPQAKFIRTVHIFSTPKILFVQESFTNQSEKSVSLNIAKSENLATCTLNRTWRSTFCTVLKFQSQSVFPAAKDCFFLQSCSRLKRENFSIRYCDGISRVQMSLLVPFLRKIALVLLYDRVHLCKSVIAGQFACCGIRFLDLHQINRPILYLIMLAFLPIHLSFSVVIFS